MGWQITEVVEDQTHLLMLGLWIDVLLHSCIDPTKVHASSVQADHWSLHLGVNLKELRITIFDHNFEEFLHFLWAKSSHGHIDALLLVWL